MKNKNTSSNSEKFEELLEMENSVEVLPQINLIKSPSDSETPKRRFNSPPRSFLAAVQSLGQLHGVNMLLESATPDETLTYNRMSPFKEHRAGKQKINKSSNPYLEHSKSSEMLASNYLQ